MSRMPTLRLTQTALGYERHCVEIALEGMGVRQTTEVRFPFRFDEDDQRDLRWYLEEYLDFPEKPHNGSRTYRSDRSDSPPPTFSGQQGQAALARQLVDTEVPPVQSENPPDPLPLGGPDERSIRQVHGKILVL